MIIVSIEIDNMIVDIDRMIVDIMKTDNMIRTEGMIGSMRRIGIDSMISIRTSRRERVRRETKGSLILVTTYLKY